MKFKSRPIHTRTIASALGPVTLAATAHGLAGLWFEAQRHWPDTQGWLDDPGHPVLQRAAEQAAAYLEGWLVRFDLPLDLSHGTAFQQAVWRGLLDIERGRTESYGALAARIGQPGAVRAVAAAVGRNPLSVVVPCHRVLGASGDLTGYAGGLDRKVALLALEGARWTAPQAHEAAAGSSKRGHAASPTAVVAAGPIRTGAKPATSTKPTADAGAARNGSAKATSACAPAVTPFPRTEIGSAR